MTIQLRRQIGMGGLNRWQYASVTLPSPKGRGNPLGAHIDLRTGNESWIDIKQVSASGKLNTGFRGGRRGKFPTAGKEEAAAGEHEKQDFETEKKVANRQKGAFRDMPYELQ